MLVWKLVTSSCIWLYSPDQYTVCLVQCKGLGNPCWPACNCLCWACLLLVGMIILVLGRSQFSMVIYLQKFQLSCFWGGMSCIWLGHPTCIMCLSKQRSYVVQWFHEGVASCLLMLACWWCHALALWGAWSDYLMVPIWRSNQQVDWWSFYILDAEKYDKVLINEHCSLDVSCFILSTRTFSKGFWSVWSWNLLPSMKWWNFFMAQATARDSSSAATQAFWCCLRVLLTK